MCLWLVAGKVSPGESLEVAFVASGLGQNMREHWLWEPGGSLEDVCYKLELSSTGQGTSCPRGFGKHLPGWTLEDDMGSVYMEWGGRCSAEGPCGE